MTYYKMLNITNYVGHTVIVGLNEGTFYEGILDIDSINENWEEDGEREALGLQMGEHLEGIYLDTIKFIAKTSDVCYVDKAG